MVCVWLPNDVCCIKLLPLCTSVSQTEGALLQARAVLHQQVPNLHLPSHFTSLHAVIC